MIKFYTLITLIFVHNNYCQSFALLINRYNKRPLGRPRCRRKENIKIDLSETELKGVDWVQLAQDRSYFKHDKEISFSLKGGEILDHLNY
jgi:hypothetical protein